MRSNRASKTGIQLKMFRKQLTKQFRGLSIIHTVEQCEGSTYAPPCTKSMGKTTVGKVLGKILK